MVFVTCLFLQNRTFNERKKCAYEELKYDGKARLKTHLC